MAWVEQLPSGRYRGMYRDGSNRKKSAGTFDSKRAAQQAANAAEVGARQLPARSDVTFGEWCPVWSAGRQVEDSTRREDQKRLARHVLPQWEDDQLADISRADVQAWAIELVESGLSASTVRKIVGVLSSAMKAAVLADLIPANPCTGVELPKIPPSPERWLSSAEVDAIREVLADGHQLAFELLVGTGMRWGEATGLHWDHVDLDAGTIQVVWAHDRAGKFFKPPKTHAKRTIPIGERLANLLDARLEESGYGAPPAGVEYREMRKPGYGLVLGTSAGTPPNGVSFAHALEAAGQAAFVGEGNRRRRVGHVRPHDLRHTYASLLVQSGVPIQAVGKLLGHGSLSVTQRYASVGDSQWDSIRSVLG
ncbi:tyrosine-type recombinase/integrase [Rhodococcus sp. NPDC004095]